MFFFFFAGKTRDEILRQWNVDPALVTPEVIAEVYAANPWLKEADDVASLNKPPVAAEAPVSAEEE